MRTTFMNSSRAQTYSVADFVGFPRRTKLGKAKSSDVAFSILFRFHIHDFSAISQNSIHIKGLKIHSYCIRVCNHRTELIYQVFDYKKESKIICLMKKFTLKDEIA